MIHLSSIGGTAPADNKRVAPARPAAAPENTGAERGARVKYAVRDVSVVVTKGLDDAPASQL
jgi:hypothetical protein